MKFEWADGIQDVVNEGLAGAWRFAKGAGLAGDPWGCLYGSLTRLAFNVEQLVVDTPFTVFFEKGQRIYKRHA